MPPLSLFIDGAHGTTGLKIRELVKERKDIQLIRLPEKYRKNTEARLEACSKAEIAVLCLPESASTEIVPALESLSCKVIDCSTAFRTDSDWVYGLPELGADFKAAIRSAKKVANPGCFATGFHLIVSPLVRKNYLPAETKVHCHAVSGYSGGGKTLIAEFEADKENSPIFFHYGLGLEHKHLPEMQKYSCLEKTPFFRPSVTKVYRGMLVSVVLDREQLSKSPKEIVDFYSDYYAEEPFVRIQTENPELGRSDIQKNNHTNLVEISVFENRNYLEIISCLDNLGKGASGAAVQNIYWMSGQADETLDLTTIP